MRQKWFCGILGIWRRWLFTWVCFNDPAAARRALDHPGPVSPDLAIACLHALGRCGRGQAALWSPIASEAFRRCQCRGKRGQQAFQKFIDWLDAETGRLATAQFDAGVEKLTTAVLWQEALDLCHALLESGAHPAVGVDGELRDPSWMLPELCSVIGLHAACPSALIYAILHQRGPSGERGSPVMDGRLCALALTTLPNDWIELWLTPMAAVGRENFLSHMLAWKILGTGVLDDAGARLLRMLGPKLTPFSQTLRLSMVSTSLWRWRANDATWDKLLDSAGRLGGWAWAGDMLSMLGSNPERGVMPRCLADPIEATDWESATRAWIKNLGPPPRFVFDRLRGQAGEAILFRMELEHSLATACAPEGPHQRSRAL